MKNKFCKFCGKNLSKKNKIGYCRQHTHKNSREPQKLCNHCGKKLRSDNKSGYCRECSSPGNRETPKLCKVCGKKLRSTNQWGYCRKHRTQSEKWKEISKKAHKKNPEIGRKAYKKYRENNPEKVKEAMYNWCAKGSETYKLWAKRMRAKRRAALNNAEGHFTQDDILELKQLQKNKCYYCGCSLNDNYHVDHKRPLSKGGSNWPKNLAVTCPLCNLRKNDMTEQEFIKKLKIEGREGGAWVDI